MKKLKILSVIFIITSCQLEQQDELLQLQEEHLTKSMLSALDNLKMTVTQTGMTSYGLDLIDRSNKLLEQSEIIISEDDLSKVRQLTYALIKSSVDETDIKGVPIAFLEDSFQNLTSDNVKSFKSNLKIFIAEKLNAYLKEYRNQFAMFDIVSGFVLTQSNYIKLGEDFHAQIGLAAAQSALNPKMYVRKQGQKEYFPISVDGPLNSGNFSLKSTKPGKHSLDIKIVYLSGGMENQIEMTHDFWVLK